MNTMGRYSLAPGHEKDPIGADAGIPWSIPEWAGAMGEHIHASCLIPDANRSVRIPGSSPQYSGAKPEKLKPERIKQIGLSGFKVFL